MAHSRRTPPEMRDTETRQSSRNITGGRYGDHTRILQGDVNFTIGGTEAADLLRSHLNPQYGNIRGGMSSTEHHEIRLSEQKQLQDVFDMFVRESRRADVALAQCRIQDHNQDKVLDGFIYNSIMQTWFSSRSSLLCCWLETGKRATHTHVAKCILFKVLQDNTGGVDYVFLYDHSEDTAIELPGNYLSAKAKSLGMKGEDPWKRRVGERHHTKETVLLSFAMQVKARGFAIPLEEIDFSGPTQLTDSLIYLIIEALHSVLGHVFFALEWADAEEPVAEVSETLDVVNGLLSKSRKRNLSHNCSVIMSVREIPELSSLLKGHPSVRGDSDYKECLDSLQLKGGSLRRDEIARPVFSSNLWIWDHPSLKRLLNSHSGALAIIGKPGCGKSVLAKTIQQGVSDRWSRMSQLSGTPDLLVCDWFYCRRKGDIFTAYSSLLRNILFQLLLERTTLFQHYKVLYRRRLSSRSKEWVTEDLTQIIENINTSGLSILMIFDAIDEAEDDSMVSFVETLVSRPGSSIKAILLSRPTESFERPFWETHKVILQEENSQDIHLVVQQGLFELASIMSGKRKGEEGGIPAHGNFVTGERTKFRTHAALRQNPFPNPQSAADSLFMRHQLCSSLNLDVLGKNVRERAGGVILWVVLVFDSIFKFVQRQPLVTLRDLMSCIAELPRDIDQLYGQIVKDLADTTSSSALHTARQTLMWINAASRFRAFTMEELWDALAASSPDLNDSGSDAPRRALIDGRIEIQSWKDFNRILRRLCGSLIEILPPKSDTGADSQAISGKCIVQLMHQTVKDFLTSSPAAGVFSFTETYSQCEALRGCQNFIRYVLPDEIDSIISLPRNRPQDWIFFSANMARYLEELRLFPLCLQLFNAFPESLGALQTQVAMKRYGLLPRWLHELGHLDLSAGWKYDFAERTLTASALGLMFQFISRRGLRHAAQNLLLFLDMGTTQFLPRYRDVILNALAFAVFDLEETDDTERLRARLLTPGGKRRESANLALNNLYYETTICDDLFDDEEKSVRVPVEDSVETIELVMDHNAGEQWDLEA